jgi:hypothetical protein
MATNTMDAIKKKMQAMKLEKEAALDKADQLEQKLSEQKEVNEKVCAFHFYVTLLFKNTDPCIIENVALYHFLHNYKKI